MSNTKQSVYPRQSNYQNVNEEEANKLDAAAAFVNQQGDNEDDDDKDYDFKEFEDAEVEEAEDRIYNEYKARQAKGSAMDEQVLSQLAGNVRLDDMESSVIMSARNGAFQSTRAVSKFQSKQSRVDLSSRFQANRGPSTRMKMNFKHRNVIEEEVKEDMRESNISVNQLVDSNNSSIK